MDIIKGAKVKVSGRLGTVLWVEKYGAIGKACVMIDQLREYPAVEALEFVSGPVPFTGPGCSLCGLGPCRLRMSYRSVYPRAPICDECAGPNPTLATAETDAWAEFYPYPIDAQLPLRREG